MVHIIVLLFFVLLTIALSLYASFSLHSSLFGKIIWHGRADLKKVALTFDDGPHPQYTRDILKILGRENIPATFFLVGKKVEAYPEVTHEIAEGGHDIGFHGYTHRPLWMKSRGTLREELDRSCHAFRTVLGSEPVLFRPPYGIRGRAVMQMAKRRGWKTIFWSQAGWDWKKISATEITRRALKKVGPGSILLLHDSDGPSFEANRQRTVDALEMIIRELRARGFGFARVSEIIE